jgi:hypothetical protein
MGRSVSSGDDSRELGTPDAAAAGPALFIELSTFSVFSIGLILSAFDYCGPRMSGLNKLKVKPVVEKNLPST